jgi:DNA-binding protein H-NS
MYAWAVRIKGKETVARALQTKTEVPSLDFSTCSFDELVEIKKEIDSEFESRKAKEIEGLRAKVSESAQALGVSIEDLFGLPSHPGKRQTKHPRGKQPVKYRGPAGEEWSGRGPSPRWMKPLLVKGKTKEDFLIK